MTRKRAAALISSLCDAVHSGETLVWCVEHAHGRDPMPEAWRQCRSASAMESLVWTMNGSSYIGIPHSLRISCRRKTGHNRHYRRVSLRRHGCRRFRRRIKLTLAYVLENAARNPPDVARQPRPYHP